MSRLSRWLSFLVVLLVVGLLYAVTAAGRRLSRLEGVTAVHCDKARQRIFVAGWGEVRILDETGRSLGILRNRVGRPARVTGVSSIASGDDGRIWIVEPPLRRVSRYLANGTFDCIAAEGPSAVDRSAAVLPLPSGRFVVSDTLARKLRLHGEQGEILRELAVPIPNGLLSLEDGLAVVVTGEGKVRAFDGDFNPRPLPAELSLPHLSGSIYEIDGDDDGAFYYHVCPRDTRCTIRRRPAGSEALEEIVAADHWLEGYDEQDPSYNFCSTSDGRILIASHTADALVEYSGALARGQKPPKNLRWEQLRQGYDTSMGSSSVGSRVRADNQVRADSQVRAFGDPPFIRWIEQGRSQRAALERQLRFGRAAMGVLLTGLLLTYLFDRLLGRHLGWNTTVRHLSSIVRRVLWPDRLAIGRWAAPSVVVALVGLLAGFFLSRLEVAGPAEGFALAVTTTLLVKGFLSGRRLAFRRSPEAAQAAFNLYMGPGALRPLSWSVAMVAEFASFAAPDSRSADWGDRLSNVLQETGRVADDPFEPTELLEGRLHLVAFGGRRLIWYPCQLGGKPRGPIKVAACRPEPVVDGPPESSLSIPRGRLVGVHPGLVQHLSAVPRFGPVETLCEECGREITPDLGRRCAHYRNRRRIALVASLLLPGLGHLVQRQVQRGRWLALASGLLLSRLFYLGLPVVLGTLPWRPYKFVLPVLLYGVLWSIALVEVHRRGKDLR